MCFTILLGAIGAILLLPKTAQARLLPLTSELPPGYAHLAAAGPGRLKCSAGSECHEHSKSQVLTQAGEGRKHHEWDSRLWATRNLPATASFSHVNRTWILVNSTQSSTKTPRALSIFTSSPYFLSYCPTPSSLMGLLVKTRKRHKRLQNVEKHTE